MTRTTMYVAVLCLGVGLFAGFGLRREPEPSPTIEHPPMKLVQTCPKISFAVEPNLAERATLWTCGEGNERRWAFKFRSEDDAEEGIQAAVKAILKSTATTD